MVISLCVVSVDFNFKSLVINDKKVRLQLVDTMGQGTQRQIINNNTTQHYTERHELDCRAF